MWNCKANVVDRYYIDQPVAFLHTAIPVAKVTSASKAKATLAADVFSALYARRCCGLPVDGASAAR
eukprot:10922162-Alexandrium_andersonii.AAC.1